MKRLFAVLLCLTLAVCLLPQQASAVSTIEQISLSVAYPEAGKAPPEAAWYGIGYSVYDTEWLDAQENRYLEEGEKIQANHQYAVTIWVEADSGYVFKAANDNTPSVTATVNNEQCEVGKAYEYKAWAMVTVTYYFGSVAVPEKGWIHRADVSLPAPVAGQAPSYTQIATTSYVSKNVYFNDKTNENMRNGIAWYHDTPKADDYLQPDNAIFAEETPYTVHFLLFPNPGYSFTPSTKVYVNGALADASFDYASFMSASYTFPPTGKNSSDDHTHFYTQWRYNSGEHYKYCTDCSEMFFLEPHKGGNATCQEMGTCTVCGFAYLPIDEENHFPDTQWTACGNLYHAHLCQGCGAHCDPQAHIPGPAATETTPQICTVCKYVMEPAKNHTHELTKVEEVPATCLKAGRAAHYACSGCSELFSDAQGNSPISDISTLSIAALTHESSGIWKYSDTEHWMICTHCQEPLVETQMEHDLTDNRCAVCGYEVGQPETEEPTTEKEEQPTEPQNQQKPGKVNWLLPILVGLVCFAAAVTTAVLILKRKG